MKKKLIKILIITVCIYLGSLTARWLYRYEYYRAETKLDYCKDIAKKINRIGISQFYCESIEEKDDVIQFYFQSNEANIASPFRQEYSEDGGIEDVAKIKNYIVNYLNEHPESELNGKKMEFVFHIIHNTSFQMYNYNYMKSEEVVDSKDFLYFEHLGMEHVSVLEGVGNACVMEASIQHMDYYDFLQNWDALQYVHISTHDLTEEQKQELKKCYLQVVFLK